MPSIFKVEKTASENKREQVAPVFNLTRGFFYPEDGGDVYPISGFKQDIHGAISQKTAFFLIKQFHVYHKILI
jgi:hypothetical protein